MLMTALIPIGAPIASGLALADIGSIVVSGAILSAMALLLLALAARRDLRLLAAISVAMIAMAVGCFLTIYLMDWNAAEAQVPIGRATVMFAVAIQTGWLVLWNVAKRRPPI